MGEGWRDGIKLHIKRGGRAHASRACNCGEKIGSKLFLERSCLFLAAHNGRFDGRIHLCDDWIRCHSDGSASSGCHGRRIDGGRAQRVLTSELAHNLEVNRNIFKSAPRRELNTSTRGHLHVAAIRAVGSAHLNLQGGTDILDLCCVDESATCEMVTVRQKPVALLGNALLEAGLYVCCGYCQGVCRCEQRDGGDEVVAGP